MPKLVKCGFQCSREARLSVDDHMSFPECLMGVVSLYLQLAALWAIHVVVPVALLS